MFRQTREGGEAVRREGLTARVSVVILCLGAILLLLFLTPITFGEAILLFPAEDLSARVYEVLPVLVAVLVVNIILTTVAVWILRGLIHGSEGEPITKLPEGKIYTVLMVSEEYKDDIRIWRDMILIIPGKFVGRRAYVRLSGVEYEEIIRDVKFPSLNLFVYRDQRNKVSYMLKHIIPGNAQSNFTPADPEHSASTTRGPLVGVRPIRERRQ